MGLKAVAVEAEDDRNRMLLQVLGTEPVKGHYALDTEKFINFKRDHLKERGGRFFWNFTCSQDGDRTAFIAKGFGNIARIFF